MTDGSPFHSDATPFCQLKRRLQKPDQLVVLTIGPLMANNDTLECKRMR